MLSVGSLTLWKGSRVPILSRIPCLVTYQKRSSYPLQKSISRLCLRRPWGRWVFPQPHSPMPSSPSGRTLWDCGLIA